MLLPPADDGSQFVFSLFEPDEFGLTLGPLKPAGAAGGGGGCLYGGGGPFAAAPALPEL